MRSRNGNRSLVFSSLTLIFAGALCADDYYIGYRITTKNILAVNETFWISKAMRPCTNTIAPNFITFKRLPNETLENVLRKEQTRFIDYASKHDLHIQNNDLYTLTSVQTLTSLTLPIRCYAVEFNDESVTISSTNE